MTELTHEDFLNFTVQFGAPRRFRKYDQSCMDNALAAVKSGMPVSAAARMHGVPRVTLMYRNSGKVKKSRMGPQTNLTEHHELTVVKWIKDCQLAGFPIVEEDVLTSVQNLVKELNLATNFKGGKPGRKWFKLFMNRHPDLLVKPPGSSKSRTLTSVEELGNWFQEVEDYLRTHNYLDVLQDATRVFNCDEATFFLNPNNKKFLVAKDGKSVYKTHGNAKKENIRVLLTASASGRLAPPMVVFKRQKMPSSIATSVPSRWGVAHSESGRMSSTEFYVYISNVFNPWLAENEIPKPVILFIDGHSSYLSLTLSKFCSKEDIILVSLYPNSKYISHPLVSAFHFLKATWPAKVREWQLANNCKQLPEKYFCPLFSNILNDITELTIANGFRRCGLHPFDRNAVPLMFEAPPIPFDSKHNTISELKCHLKYIEGAIGEQKVKDFQSVEIATEDQSLYMLWKDLIEKIKDLDPNISLDSRNSNSENTEDSEIWMKVEDLEF